MRDFFVFRRMLTTVVIQIVFWIGLIATIVAGAALIVFGVAGMTDTDINIDGVLDVSNTGGVTDLFWGLVILIGGPIVVRIVCEVVILFFRMNETLTDILNNLGPQPVAAAAVDAASSEQIDNLQDRMDDMQEDLQENMDEGQAKVDQ